MIYPLLGKWAVVIGWRPKRADSDTDVISKYFSEGRDIFFIGKAGIKKVTARSVDEARTKWLRDNGLPQNWDGMVPIELDFTGCTKP